MMKMPLWVDKKLQVTWKMRRLYHKAQCHYSTSQPPTMRTLAKPPCTRQHARVMSSMVTGRMNKSARGKEGIAKRNKGDNDYANGGKPCKAPDKIGPPVPYMEEHGVFKPLDTIANPMGLCHFYRTEPSYSNVITGPKSAAGVCRLKCLLD